MEEQDYFEHEPKRGTPFFLVLGVLLLLMIHNLFVDYGVVLQKEKMQIPQWYITLLFSLDIFAILSLVGIYFLRKIAVYVFPVLIMIHFIIHLNYLATFLYADVFMMFFYVGIGLFVFIPKWNYFK
ncbi:hypothetical protein BAX94_01800 [Elizabethkingia meningoseptica]|uniref:DoxX family protein n=1 Tax=Elizabethkingia meningoseptica TaxID=238 RepID=A0A1V3TY69_ELIME|nr:MULTISPECIES: hypothetical protein [Elizabethkingia]AQX07006.1 hypothetical protein BBD33_07200 [Elizabethkingia meningoseptica]AQX14259.1 hypothetical protein BBD35_09375 [Elizabethkingia meningoseptica]MCL1675600.1 hypothetical protein [Elizabethkingia meningoseptica]MCL1686984.1 hypothetical protein [Elizabethkingia meningoseptica]MDX8575919.1 hypothetical protein [Elizabethkingia sp. HX WYD]